MITIHHTAAELHALLDSLTHGQTVTATWKHGDFLNATTGPACINGKYFTAYYHIRNAAGCISPDITSIEAIVEQPVTVTRDDPAALLALVESLADGQKVTAEWRSKDGEHAVAITGTVERDSFYECVSMLDMWGRDYALLRGDLHVHLHSVTATAVKTIRWERQK